MEHDGYDHFNDARKQAVKEYNRNSSKGQSGYLPSLEDILNKADVVSQVNIGLIEIPLKKVIGTYTHIRSLSFAKNFMPLLDTEFKEKWSSLCSAHLNEGIRDPIKVYEYMNWYYVIEGNKRVSVLKYFNAYSVTAKVTRLIPKYDINNIENRLYFEFLNFNKITGIYSIWFTKEGSYNKLLEALENFSPDNSYFENKYKYFEVYIYNTFRRIFLEAGGDKLSISTGDALLEYLKIFGVHRTLNEVRLMQRMKEFIKELDAITTTDKINLSTEPATNTQKNVINTITSLVMPKRKIKAAFAYARTIESSGWTYAHELGRLYVEEMLYDHLVTAYIENVPENDDAYKEFRKLAEAGYDIIFTTSPIYLNSTLKCALEFPNVKFFNCSEANPYTRVSNYFGRTYEPRFLTGIIAGSSTKNNIIGYAATSPTPEVISSINAFALGAKMVNPDAVIKVAWTNEWNSRLKFTDAGNKLIKSGADILCNRTLDVPHPVSKDFGVYSMLCTIDKDKEIPDKYLATPIWNWGKFYERIIYNIITNNSAYKVDMSAYGNKSLNLWWGIDTGVVDIFYSKELVPNETQKLVNLLKKMIISREYHPFTGPVYDKEGNLRIKAEETASFEDILSMNWYVDNVEI